MAVGPAAAQYNPRYPAGPGVYREAPDDDEVLADPRDAYPAPAPYRRAPGQPPVYEAQPLEPLYERPAPAPLYGVARRPYFVPPPDGEPMDRPQGDVRPFGAPTSIAPDQQTAPYQRMAPQQRPGVAALPQDEPDDGNAADMDPRLRRQLVPFRTKEPAGTLIVDTAHTYLYLVLGDGQAMRYGIGVGREGFTWTGAERVSRMKEWPDWYPPKEMLERQPDLPRMMAGGPGNPLGARALYLGQTLYRIHGTSDPKTIGKYVSSGCIRLVNEDIEDLYRRVQVGTRVVVLPGRPPATVLND
ncbi:MAG: L,D-transpeptidase [Xanthobacteraceae bacterium]|nr:L,D-transpeptidase [Xanthobacteraceae bacterium]